VIDQLDAGDVLMVTRLDRLARSTPSTARRTRLARNMMAQFFSQPIRGDKPALKLVVDNGPSAPPHRSL
jgi:hypothetical protein